MKRILVIDDDPDIRDSIGTVLELGGYDCAMAPSGAQALELIAKQDFDVLVLDQMMPSMSGTECLTELRKRDKSIPVIFVSADRHIERKTEGLEGCRTIRKPFDLPQLLGTLDELLGAN